MRMLAAAVFLRASLAALIAFFDKPRGIRGALLLRVCAAEQLTPWRQRFSPLPLAAASYISPFRCRFRRFLSPFLRCFASAFRFLASPLYEPPSVIRAELPDEASEPLMPVMPLICFISRMREPLLQRYFIDDCFSFITQRRD